MARMVLLTLLMWSGALFADSVDVSGRYLHFSVYGFGDSARSLIFPTAKASISGGDDHSGVAVVDSNASVGAGLELWHSEPHSFGWAAGLTYDSRRVVNDVTLKNMNSSVPPFYNGFMPSFTIWTVYAEGVYRFDDFYFPFGINFSIPNYSDAPGDPGSTTFRGSIGPQGGAGYHVTSHFAVEALLRTLAFTAKRDEGNVSYNLGPDSSSACISTQN